MRRIYTCGTCGGPVVKPACPTNDNGLGHWKCVTKGCVRADTSINQAGAMNAGVDNNGRRFVTGPVQTGRSSKAVVRVKMVRE